MEVSPILKKKLGINIGTPKVIGRYLNDVRPKVIGVWTKPHEKSLMRFCSKLIPSQNTHRYTSPNKIFEVALFGA